MVDIVNMVLAAKFGAYRGMHYLSEFLGFSIDILRSHCYSLAAEVERFFFTTNMRKNEWKSTYFFIQAAVDGE